MKLGDIKLRDSRTGSIVVVRIASDGLHTVGSFGAAVDPLSENDWRALRMCEHTYPQTATTLGGEGHLRAAGFDIPWETKS